MRAINTFIIAVLLTSAADAAQVTVNTYGTKSFNPAIRGQNPLDHLDDPASRNKALELCYDVMMRGVSGGLYADTYDWRDQSVWDTYRDHIPTLDFLRDVRDHNGTSLFTVNARGIGEGCASTPDDPFHYTDTSISTLATMAADWVRYTNHVAQHYTTNNLPAGGDDKRIYDGLSWGAYDKLPGPTEAKTPLVKYWEIGNEPYNDFLPTTLSASEYRDRYKAITEAMIAADPNSTDPNKKIKVGPDVGLINSQLDAVLADPTAQVDFISNHPYYNHLWDKTTAAEMESGLKGIKADQISKCNLIVHHLQTYGRPTDTPIILSEWAPMGELGKPTANSMTQALGVAETCFAFAEIDHVEGACFWLWPGKNGNEMPSYQVFDKLQDHMGDTLIYTTSLTTATRLYVTHDSKTGEYAVWGLNFSNSQDETMNVNLDTLGLDGIQSATLETLGWTSEYVDLYGQTTLLNPIPYNPNNSSEVNYATYTAYIDWTSAQLSDMDLSNISFLLPHAQMTCLVLAVPEPSGISMLAALTVGLLCCIRREN